MYLYLYLVPRQPLYVLYIYIESIKDLFVFYFVGKLLLLSLFYTIEQYMMTTM